MSFLKHRDARIGALFFVLSLIAIFVWIPSDTATALVERVRGRTTIGDALAPTIAATILAVSSLLLLFGFGRTDPNSGAAVSIRFLAGAFAILFVSLALMRWVGPVAVALFGPQGQDYRVLRDTFPWKYLGFLVGGTFMVAAPIMGLERRFRWQIVGLAFVIVLVLALFYGGLFDNLILPPNGDV